MPPSRDHLPRLAREAYRGRAGVHWTFTTRDRATGWLTPLFHAVFREVLLHALDRHHAFCPAYCLMPDHAHVLLLGVREEADLYLAARFLRRHTAAALAPARYQRQAYDHVLRGPERERGALERTGHYLQQNPVRAGLCAEARGYPYRGRLVPGYPALDADSAESWEVFWEAYRLAATL